MDLDITSKTQKTARQFHINAEQLAFADLVAVGWPIEDAWTVAIRKGATWNRKAQQEAQETLLKNEGVQQRIDDVQSVLAQKQTDRIREKMSEDKKGLLERATNKEQKLIELQTLIENGGLKPGSTEYNKINDQIIQVSQMKKDDIKTEDNTKHFFLPVNYPTSCENCIIHLNGLDKKHKQQ
jgi:hypothetical protein